MHTVGPLKSFVHDRVVLLGDAVSPALLASRPARPALTVGMQAHAMMPYQGSGAGQAIEVCAPLLRTLSGTQRVPGPARTRSS